MKDSLRIDRVKRKDYVSLFKMQIRNLRQYLKALSCLAAGILWYFLPSLLVFRAALADGFNKLGICFIPNKTCHTISAYDLVETGAYLPCYASFRDEILQAE